MKGGFAFAALIGIAGGAAAAAGGQSAPTPPAASSLAGTEKLCGLTAASAGEFEPQVAKLPGIMRKSDQNGYRVYIEDAKRRIWDFTTSAIPGHPAAACISVVPDGRGSQIKVEIVCEGSQPDCDAIAASFKVLAARTGGRSDEL
ncbi:MAG: hypothetical protein ABIR08_09260 [Sphingomonas sp.]